MEIILHVGAHRTGLTSYCDYLAAHRHALADHGLAVWTPQDTRAGLFDGLTLPSGRAGVEKRRARGTGRVRLRLERLRRAGIDGLLVVDPGMIGGIGDNFRRQRLYPAAGERAARMGDAFGGRVTRVMLTVRALEDYWSSALAWAVPRGGRVPNRAALDRLVTQPRSWRDVVTDLACAFPGAELLVAPYERMGGHFHELVEFAVAGRFAAPRDGEMAVLRPAPALGELRQVLRDRGLDPTCLPEGWGRWRPFEAAQTATLREIYADDLHWLRVGAGGAGFLIEETGSDRAGMYPLAGA